MAFNDGGPPEQSVIYIIATAIATAIVAGWAAIKRILRMNGDSEMELFRQQMTRDMERIEEKIDKAVDRIEENLTKEVRALRNSYEIIKLDVAINANEIEHLKSRKK